MQLPNNQPAAKRVAVSAVLASLALIFSYIEAILPAAPGIPGIKLGIANLVVIVAMYRLNSRYALTINLIRILLAFSSTVMHRIAASIAAFEAL